MSTPRRESNHEPPTYRKNASLAALLPCVTHTIEHYIGSPTSGIRPVVEDFQNGTAIGPLNKSLQDHCGIQGSEFEKDRLPRCTDTASVNNKKKYSRPHGWYVHPDWMIKPSRSTDLEWILSVPVM
ncbi:hypothetical protein T265_08647 [Opisthorchis viverrini]|uniref:Uncharacterized protein n=1 Tax=Opisthorchis viverrini TaxID=6198 RepID=A0A075A7N4_OPIVI|nr:hypothetical protein T265_08647 [Opisthorchis viverrini]KER23484.1 hypothetical protein T265_08647 [Opisthorchis viverrini]